MASKQRMTELRITRNGTQRHRSLCGGTVIGDYVDPQNGERVLTIKTVSIPRILVRKTTKAERAQTKKSEITEAMQEATNG